MLFSLFGWELVWIRKFERISIRNPDQTLSVTSHPRRAAISTLPRWFDRYFLPTQSFPNPEPEQCQKWWWLFIAEQKCSKKGCSMRTKFSNIFRSSKEGGNVPRTDPFFHLTRMDLDSWPSGVTANCPIKDNWLWLATFTVELTFCPGST